MPVASAQVKSALLLAGLAAGCSVTIREEFITRDHTELMLRHLGTNIEIREIKPIMEPDPVDPRKKRRVMPESFRKEIILGARSKLTGGEIDIPGDISTAAFYFALAALSGKPDTSIGPLDKIDIRAVRCAIDLSPGTEIAPPILRAGLRSRFTNRSCPRLVPDGAFHSSTVQA